MPLIPEVSCRSPYYLPSESPRPVCLWLTQSPALRENRVGIAGKTIPHLYKYMQLEMSQLPGPPCCHAATPRRVWKQ